MSINQRRRQIPNENYYYLKVPFINEELNWKIKSIFRSEGIPVRLYHSNHSFRSILSKGCRPRECNSVSCPFKLSRLCHADHVVYEAKCNTCSQRYIGSTIRPLHSRMAEHIRSTNSSIYKHLQQCIDMNRQRIEDKLTLKVLVKEKDAINLRIKEAILLRQNQPEMNSREELKELKMLL